MDETNCNSEFFNIDLERFSNVGFIEIVKISWSIIINKDIEIIWFTMNILFRPAVHSAINSLSFSNFIIVRTIAIKKQKGISLVKTFEDVRIEYIKYIEKACPSSVTRSRKLTACTVHTIAASVNRDVAKYLKNS